MSWQKALTAVKNFLVYDADKKFYAKVFPGSVSRQDLIRIRRMHPEDLASVIAIEGENYSFPWSPAIFGDCLGNITYNCWVCEDSGEIIGFAVVSIGAGEAHIMNICVRKTSAKQGIGTKLLDNIIATTSKKAARIFLEVRPSNLAATALYHKRGFQQIGRRKSYYPSQNGPSEDAIVLALDLDFS